jgi:membrane fusion protein (multidrug efflux system)
VQIDAVDRLQVAFAISELGILFTRVGAPVEVRVAPYPGETFRGEVFFVSPTLDPSTRRIVAKAWVPNEGRRLRAGLFADVDMEIDRRENAILVPETAVVFDRQGTYVWRLDAEDVATRVPVETGLRREGRVEITLGLQAGDRIVSAGTHKVQEGEKVVASVEGAAAAGQARRRAATAGQGT